MHGAFAAGPVERAAHSLSVDRDDARDGVREALRPGDEAVLEAGRVERAEDEAKLVMARRAVRKRQETTQERDFLPAKQGGAHPAVSPAQHRAQRQKQHFFERVKNLDRLARVGKRRKMFKKIKLSVEPFGRLFKHRSVSTPRIHDRALANDNSAQTATQDSFDCPGRNGDADCQEHEKRFKHPSCVGP